MTPKSGMVALVSAGGLLALSLLHTTLAQGGWHLRHIYTMEPTQPTGTVEGAALSPDGHHIAVELRWGAVTPEGQITHDIDQLQLWDVDGQRQIAKTNLASRPNSAVGKPVGCLYRFTRFSSDGREILVCDGRKLQLLSADTLALLREVDLSLPVLPANSKSNLAVDGVELTKDGKQAAVVLGDDRGGTVRIYGLGSGMLIREWTYESLNVGLTGRRLAWSPNGKYLALSVYPVIPGQRVPPRAKTILIYDSTDSQLVQAIHTDYLAGPVTFASDGLLLTASLETAIGRDQKDAIEEWDVRSGKLMRRFTSSPDGPRYQLAISGDGRILVGYVTKERMAEHFVRETAQRFELWDLQSGESLFASKPIALSPVGQRNTQVETDVTGNRVLVWKQATREPLLVYDLSASN